MALLLRGLRGEPVKRLQEKLGLQADGIFGAGTEKAVQAFQKEHGLAADGIAGPDTFAAMDLVDLILLKRGTRGQTVEKVQTALGITADGIYGPGTEKAVQAFQKEKGLQVDGIVGPETLAVLDLPGVLTPAGAVAKARWESLEETTPGPFARIKKMLGDG